MPTIASAYARIKLIASGGASKIIVSLNSVIISFVVIRWQSPELWGELVVYLLFLDFGFSVIAWGTTPFLIREFSFHPATMKADWGKSFNARIPLLFIFLVFIAFSPFAHVHKLVLVIWAMARYMYHAFESIIQYERNFIFSLSVELSGLLVVLVPMVIRSGDIDLSLLIYLFSASMLWRATAATFFFRSYLNFSLPDKKFYFQAFPFLLITFSAMLQQRSDLYSVAYYLPQHDTARYQVFINLLIFSQFLASLLLSPFAKNIFRLSGKSFARLESQFILWGIPFAGISLAGIYMLMVFFYKLDLSWKMYLLGYFYILMFYVYQLKNYHLGKINKQARVALYCFIASGVNILASMVLIPKFQLEGALLAGLTAQITLAFLYHQSFLSNAAR
jgi:O-antigen/teichoic acid export membrane protein